MARTRTRPALDVAAAWHRAQVRAIASPGADPAGRYLADRLGATAATVAVLRGLVGYVTADDREPWLARVASFGWDLAVPLYDLADPADNAAPVDLTLRRVTDPPDGRPKMLRVRDAARGRVVAYTHGPAICVLDAARQGRKLVVAEGALDFVSCCVAFPAEVAVLGLPGVSSAGRVARALWPGYSAARELVRQAGAEIVLALHEDLAGDSAAQAFRQALPFPWIRWRRLRCGRDAA